MQELSGPVLFGQCLGSRAPRQFAAEAEWLLCVLSCRSATLGCSMKCNGGTQIEYIDLSVIETLAKITISHDVRWLHSCATGDVDESAICSWILSVFRGMHALLTGHIRASHI